MPFDDLLSFTYFSLAAFSFPILGIIFFKRVLSKSLYFIRIEISHSFVGFLSCHFHRFAPGGCAPCLHAVGTCFKTLMCSW